MKQYCLAYSIAKHNNILKRNPCMYLIAKFIPLHISIGHIITLGVG